MKLQIIETPGYILAVSDEEIKEGDWCVGKGFKGANIFKWTMSQLKQHPNYIAPKVAAYQPKNNAKELDDLPLLPEMVVKDDVEKLAELKYPINSTKGKIEMLSRHQLNNSLKQEGFIEGYKAATKVYSEEDVCDFVEWMNLHYRALEHTIASKDASGTRELLQYWTQSKALKIPKWFVAETTGGGEYLAGKVGGNEIWAEYPTELKTTTINDKEYLVGTYLYE